MRNIAPGTPIQSTHIIKPFKSTRENGENVNIDNPSLTKRPITKRRAVACKSCHSLKVKCIPSNEDDLSSPCVRCLKTSRNCEIDLTQTRKKRKPDDRVSELESKIEKLTTQLHQQRQLNSNGANDRMSPGSTSSIHGSPRPLVHSANAGAINPPNYPKMPFTSTTELYDKLNNSSVEFVNENNQFPPMTKKSSSSKSTPKSSSNLQFSSGTTQEEVKLSRAQQIDQLIGSNILTEISNYVTTTTEARLQKIVQPPVDIIDRGLISLEEAKVKYDLYQTSVYSKYPFVKIPNNFESFRQEQPILFVTIMTITGIIEDSVDDSDINRDIDFEVLALKEAVHEFLLIGNKSIELLKSLLLLSIWYNTPELFHHRRYHIISSLCLSMSQDLGLTGRAYYAFNKNEGSFKRGTAIEDPQNQEHRMLCMGVYCASIGFSLFLRRRLQVQWTTYMENSYQVLMNSQDDKIKNVALLGKVSSLMERIHIYIENSDESNFILIDMFQQEIETFKHLPNTFQKDVYLGFISSIEAFLFAKFSSVEYSIKCYHACGTCIEHFAKLTPDETVVIPVLIFGRLMYCFALFLKTTNVLKLGLDIKLIKSLLNTLEQTQRKYKKNHMVVKIRLLFYFYLTTYAKDEDVFNNVAEVSSADAVSKSIVTHQEKLKGGLHPSQSEPNLANINFQMSRFNSADNYTANSAPQYSQIRFQDDGFQQQQQLHNQQQQQHLIQQPQVQLPPINDTQFLRSQRNSSVDQFGAGSLPNLNASNGFPQTQIGGPELQQQTSQQVDSNAPLNSQTGNSYPLLDALSDATMKGFNEFSSDFLGNQNDFWKMFDYKDDQFFL